MPWNVSNYTDFSVLSILKFIKAHLSLYNILHILLPSVHVTSTSRFIIVFRDLAITEKDDYISFESRQLPHNSVYTFL